MSCDESLLSKEQKERVERVVADAVKKGSVGKIDYILLKKQEDTQQHRKPRDGLRKSYRQIAVGVVQDCKEMIGVPFGLVKDVVKARDLVAEGRFRALGGRFALRIHGNLVKLGVLSKSIEKRIEDANKKIEERLGIENRESNPNMFSKISGREVKRLRASLKEQIPKSVYHGQVPDRNR